MKPGRGAHRQLERRVAEKLGRRYDTVDYDVQYRFYHEGRIRGGDLDVLLLGFDDEGAIRRLLHAEVKSGRRRRDYEYGLQQVELASEYLAQEFPGVKRHHFLIGPSVIARYHPEGGFWGFLYNRWPKILTSPPPIANKYR